MKALHMAPVALGVSGLLAGSALATHPTLVDWKAVPPTTLTLFYPAQSSFQWVRGSEHPGGAAVAGGAACTACHAGQEEKLGNKLVKANRLEPTPIDGKNGTVQLAVQVAYDEKNAYFRAQWKTRNPYPGAGYPYLRFDGKEWKPYGAPRLAPAARKGDQPAIYEDRLSMMIDDGGVPAFASHGCWLTCHQGSRDMPNQATRDQVQANALYQAIKRNDVRKYLPSTRTDEAASWDKGRTIAEIEKVKKSGGFLDLIQWRAHRSNPIGMADDGYVLEWRNFDAGKNPFTSNFDAKAGRPLFMFDDSRTGMKALTVNDLGIVPPLLVRNQNAVAFNPEAGWQAGALLPQFVLSREEASGSAADNMHAHGTWKDGLWTVVWARPLNLANPDDKALRESRAYNFSFAVHDDNVTTRGHYVSFPVTVGFGTKATITATKLK